MGEIDELEITVKPANKYAELNEAILDFSLQMAANTEKAQGGKRTKQDSLSASDAQAIRKLTEVYDVLSNPVQENDDLHLVTDNNGHCV